jgi:hypothetical protein
LMVGKRYSFSEGERQKRIIFILPFHCFQASVKIEDKDSRYRRERMLILSKGNNGSSICTTLIAMVFPLSKSQNTLSGAHTVQNLKTNKLRSVETVWKISEVKRRSRN